jgi:hypothetical protein
MLVRSFFLALGLVLCLRTTAKAANVAECEEPGGWIWVRPAGLAANNPRAGKWLKDKTSSGKIVLTRRMNGTLDLLFSTARGEINSARNNGAQIVMAGKSAYAISVVVSYPGRVLETYAFFPNEVLLTSIKYGEPVDLVRAMHANCSMVNLKLFARH